MSWSSSSKGGPANHSYDQSGKSLTALYNSPIQKAEHVFRPLSSSSFQFGPVSHSGVRVTLNDGSQYLIHKGANYGKSSETVVVDARHMSSAWEVRKTTDFQGTKNVSDLVRAGGAQYKLFSDNCHDAANRMMEK